jgi:hypothetical protein
MGFTRSEFFGRPPLFLPGSWVLVLGVIAFCYSIVFIGIVFGDTENEHLKIAAFILLFASFIVSISGISWNYYFYEQSNRDSILREAYGGYNVFVREDENGRLIYVRINTGNAPINVAALAGKSALVPAAAGSVANTTVNNNDPDATVATQRTLNNTTTNIEINEAAQ